MQKSNWGATIARYITEGRTVSGGCGASSDQETLEKEQLANYNTLAAESETEFGEAQGVFNQLSSQFSPILSAGINQQGYTPAEMAQLNSQAATSTGQSAAMAKQAANSQIAAEGGAANLPSGAAIEANTGIAEEAGQQLASTELNTQEQSEALGRQNWLTAASVLGGATGDLGASTGAANAATGAGSAAGTTANQIVQANQAAFNGITGAITGAAGSVASFPGL